jgi:hypothetical protein
MSPALILLVHGKMVNAFLCLPLLTVTFSQVYILLKHITDSGMPIHPPGVTLPLR